LEAPVMNSQLLYVRLKEVQTATATALMATSSSSCVGLCGSCASELLYDNEY